MNMIIYFHAHIWLDAKSCKKWKCFTYNDNPTKHSTIQHCEILSKRTSHSIKWDFLCFQKCQWEAFGIWGEYITLDPSLACRFSLLSVWSLVFICVLWYMVLKAVFMFSKKNSLFLTYCLQYININHTLNINPGFILYIWYAYLRGCLLDLLKTLKYFMTSIFESQSLLCFTAPVLLLYYLAQFEKLLVCKRWVRNRKTWCLLQLS